MRKQDYAVLVETIKKHRDSALGYAAQTPDPCQTAKAEACEAIARTFARFASVDKTAFLKACGIE